MNIALSVLLVTWTGLVRGCVDKNELCEAWTNEGYCTTLEYKDFMGKYCTKSCGSCVIGSVTTVNPTPEECEDIRPKVCSVFVKNRLCRKSTYIQVMEQECRRSCGFCPSEAALITSPDGSQDDQMDVNILSLYGRSCGKPKRFTKIGWTEEALPHVWNWQVSIYLGTEIHCAGSLITPEWVVTAAHCIIRFQASFDKLRVVLGDHDRSVVEGTEQDLTVSKVVVHPEYNKNPLYYMENDIALIRLSGPARITREVSVVCIGMVDDIPHPGQNCIVTAWAHDPLGEDRPILQQAILSVVTMEVCKAHNLPHTANTSLPDSVICAGDELYSQSSCRGDHGGPLVCRQPGMSQFQLHGIVSWGADSCRGRESYTVFTKVATFREWIEKQIA